MLSRVGDNAEDLVVDALHDQQTLEALATALKADPASVLPPEACERAVVVLTETNVIQEKAVLARASARADFEARLRAGLSAVEKLKVSNRAAVLTNDELVGLALVMRLAGRPALLFDNAGDFEDPPGIWSGLDAKRDAIRRVAKSVGRIGTARDPGGLGTGFVVAPNIVMTNAHVVDEIHDVANAFIDFAATIGAKTPVRFAISAILDRHPTCDLALLRVGKALDKSTALPAALTMAAAGLTAGAKRDVYVIGHPTSDNEGKIHRAVFAALFPVATRVKRVSPGRIFALDGPRRAFRHDATTLGGNSGSPVVDLATHRVLGLHYSGLHMTGNLAVDLARLVDDPLLKSNHVQFG